MEIETPEGIKTGSAVREGTAQMGFGKSIFPAIKAIQYRTYGEAIIIDLGEAGYLLYPIGWHWNELETKFPFSGKKNDYKGIINHYSSLKNGDKVTQKGWISFVYLDENDSTKSFQRLDSKDFEKVFGPEISLNSLTTEIVNDPITWELSDFLNRVRLKLGRYSKSSFQFKR